MDEAPRARGDEGYGACFDDMRAQTATLLSKEAAGLF